MYPQWLTSVFINGEEYSAVREGSTPLWLITQILERDSSQQIVRYRRLLGYGLFRTKKEANQLLASLVRGIACQKQKRKETHRQKYVLGFNRIQSTPADWAHWPMKPPVVTRKLYRVYVIDDPYKEKCYQQKKEYLGPEVATIKGENCFDRAQFEQVIKQLNQCFWQERAQRLQSIPVDMTVSPPGH